MLIVFLVAMTKWLAKAIQVTIHLEVQSFTERKTWQQMQVTADPIASAVRKQRVERLA